MKNFSLLLLKYVAPPAILVWLVLDIRNKQVDAIERIQNLTIDWAAISIALLLTFIAVLITLVRWFYLVRAIGLPMSLQESMRLGLLGYLLNFVSVGNVGGDLFKAVFIARRAPGRRAEAVATIVVDRLVGTLGLVLLATCAVLLSELESPGEEVTLLCNLTLVAGAISFTVVLIFLFPALQFPKLAAWLIGTRHVGPIFQQVFSALGNYRGQPRLMGVMLALSTLSHIFYALALYVVAESFFAPAPNLAETLVIVPLSWVAGSVPLPLAALGAFEAGMEFLYVHIPDLSVEQATGQGLVVALTYRVFTILIAAVGMIYYWSRRAEVQQTLAAAKEQKDDSV